MLQINTMAALPSYLQQLPPNLQSQLVHIPLRNGMVHYYLPPLVSLTSYQLSPELCRAFQIHTYNFPHSVAEFVTKAAECLEEIETILNERPYEGAIVGRLEAYADKLRLSI